MITAGSIGKENADERRLARFALLLTKGPSHANNRGYECADGNDHRSGRFARRRQHTELEFLATGGVIRWKFSITCHSTNVPRKTGTSSSYGCRIATMPPSSLRIIRRSN